MGYTHYWDFKKKPSNIQDGKEKFAHAVALFREGLKKMQDIKLAGGMGKGKPTIEDDVICFNGKGEDSAETCAMTINDSGLEFCKTERNNYDAAVCLLLLCMKSEFGRNFTYHTDGDKKCDEGWVMATQAFNEL